MLWAIPSNAQAPSPVPSPSPSEPEKPPIWEIGERVEYEINSWFAGLVRSAVEPVLSLLGRTILATPRVDQHPRVRDLWRFSLAIADSALLLFLVLGSGLVIVGDGLDTQLTAKELLTRLVVAAVAVNLSLFISGWLISLSNALSAGILGASIDPTEISSDISARLLTGALANPFLAILGLLLVVLAVLVVVAYVVRIAVLVVLLAGGPLLLAGKVLPQSEAAARIWWRGVVAMLAVPVAQSLLLAAAVRVFLSGDGLLGLPSAGGLVDLLVIGCLLYLLFRIPFRAFDLVLSGAASRAWGSVKQKTVTIVKSAVVA